MKIEDDSFGLRLLSFVSVVEGVFVVSGVDDAVSGLFLVLSMETLRADEEFAKSSVIATAAMMARRSSDFSAPSKDLFFSAATSSSSSFFSSS